MKKSIKKGLKQKKINKFIYWIPRILSILFILFLSLFSLDVFDSANNYTFIQILLAFFMHNIPSLVLIVILVVSWRYEIVGGIAFILAGLLYILLILLSPNFELFMLGWLIPILGPVFLIGILFLINWKKRKK
jgi:hypothetical protein